MYDGWNLLGLPRPKSLPSGITFDQTKAPAVDWKEYAGYALGLLARFAFSIIWKTSRDRFPAARHFILGAKGPRRHSAAVLILAAPRGIFPS